MTNAQLFFKANFIVKGASSFFAIFQIEMFGGVTVPAMVRELKAGLPDSAVLTLIESDLSITQVNGV